jgi:hypothetical protein
MNHFGPRLVLGASLGLVLSCGSPVDLLPDDAPRSAVFHFEYEGVPIEVGTELSHVWILRGERVEIHVWMRNLGDESAEMPLRYCPPAVWVDDAAGNLVHPDGGLFCPIQQPSMVLEPGEEVSATLEWDGVPEVDRRPRLRRTLYHVRGSIIWSHPSIPLEVRR